MDDELFDEWADPAAVHAVRTVVRGGMPEAAIAGYVRWWQLETWLRDLIYLELRAKHGSTWASVAAAATGRQAKDSAFTHMTGADSRNPLAYLDYSQLLQIVDANWDLFAPSLIERSSWEGRQHELKQIRHRIGHLRSPHTDDLARLEQMLRDLERGAHVAYSSYNRRWQPSSWTDAVTEGWINARHPDARRLIQHAHSRYDTRINVQASARPWALSKQQVPPSAPAAGILWHADFWLQGRSLDVPRLWQDSHLRSVKPHLVHLVAIDAYAVGFTFAAVDVDVDIADSIGAAFDAVLMSTSRATEIVDGSAWRRRAVATDFRVVASYGWGLVDESTVPLTIFGSGGGVTESPSW